jgi:hypothetical protein
MLYVAPLFLGVFFELPLGGIERITQDDIDILIFLLADDDLATGYLDIEMNAELFALMLVLARHLDDHMTAHDVRKQVIQFLGFLPYVILDCVGMGDIAQGDLQRKFHGAFLS